MKPKLARAFIERGIIQRNSMLEAYHSAKGISGQYDASVLSSFRLIGAQAAGEWIYFNVLDAEKQQTRIRCDYVVSLDGMPVERIADSHHLTEDGDESTSKRRSKKKILEEDEEISELC